MKKISYLAFLAGSCFLPLFAVAQVNMDQIKKYSDSIITVINNYLVPVLIAIAFITFLWGVYKYFILGAADEKSRTDGRQFTLWGIIGFVIILSLWGIVNLFIGTLNLSAGKAPDYPTIGGSPAGQTGATTHVNGTPCTGTGVEGYAVSGTWQNNICQ